MEEPLIWDVLRPAAIAGKIDLADTEFTIHATPDVPYARVQVLIEQVKELQKKLEALSEDLKKPTPAADAPEKK